MKDKFSIALIGVIVLTVVSIAIMCSQMNSQQADFTFCNNDEIRTVDPALASGSIEGRILNGVFEGLGAFDAKTGKPGPGVAERWNISDDGLTYTFHLRHNAKWTDGTPVTAHDFYYSLHRCLLPATCSEYAYELWYIPNAKKYSTSKVEQGDRVEVELKEKVPGSLPYSRGRVIKGVLTKIVDSGDEKTESAPMGNPVYVITCTDGTVRQFQKTPKDKSAQNLRAGRLNSNNKDKAVETFEWLLPDFDTVPIRALDDWTLEIKLSHPVPYFPYLMSFYPFYPVNQKCVEMYGSPNWTRPENIVGNGPFVIEYRRIRDRIRLRRSETYWDKENVGCETIDCLAVKSIVTSLNMYIAGDVDWLQSVPVEVAAELQKRPEKDFHNFPLFGTYYYNFNMARPEFQDVRVRRALNMALDKKEFVEKVTRGGQIPATHLVPPLPGVYELIQGDEYNVEEARRLLAEAGFPGGKGFPTIEILYNTGEAHESLALLLQHQWKKNLGIDSRLQNLEWADFLTRRNLGQFQFSRMSWIGDYPDPLTFLMTFQSNSPGNNGQWRNAQFDTLLVQAEQEVDPAKRMKILAQAEQLLMDEMPLIPLYFYTSQEMVRNNVQGWYETAIDVHPMKTIRKVKKEK